MATGIPLLDRTQLCCVANNPDHFVQGRQIHQVGLDYERFAAESVRMVLEKIRSPREKMDAVAIQPLESVR